MDRLEGWIRKGKEVRVMPIFKKSNKLTRQLVDRIISLHHATPTSAHMTIFVHPQTIEEFKVVESVALRNGYCINEHGNIKSPDEYFGVTFFTPPKQEGGDKDAS
jgi:hypothetical protein